MCMCVYMHVYMYMYMCNVHMCPCIHRTHPPHASTARINTPRTHVHTAQVDFTEFVAYWRSIKADLKLDEITDMFRRFDKDGSGELNQKEFLNLLNQVPTPPQALRTEPGMLPPGMIFSLHATPLHSSVHDVLHHPCMPYPLTPSMHPPPLQVFPEHCEENETHVAAEFAAADADSSEGVSFPEFLCYYERLKRLYDKNLDDEERKARAAAEREARRASVNDPMVTCACGQPFLASVLPTHQRSCVACKPVATPEGGGQGDEVDGNGFVPCKICGRTFFPDRLPKHVRVCEQKNGKVSGIRPTMTDGATLTRGAYGTE